MKVLAVNRLYDSVASDLPKVDLLADSSIVTPGKPLFLPDVASGYTLMVAPAFRIDRLGKNIAARFAPRYYNDVTLVARVIPEDLSPDCGALATAFDSSLIEGTWIPVPGQSLPMSVAIEDLFKLEISAESTGINETIALLSRYFTLKNGDIIIPCHFSFKHNAVIDTRFRAELCNTPVIDIKIK